MTHAQNTINNVSSVSPLTYTSTTATVILWGLHLSDIAVILSALASVCGVSLQFYLAFRNSRNRN